MRLLFVDNLMIRRYGQLKLSPGRALTNGAVRNNWRICEFSDRDIARFESAFYIRPVGHMMANVRLVETCGHFKPDVILIGNCDIIQNWALLKIRRVLPQVKMAHFNVDPLWQESTKRQIRERMETCDALFATTGGAALRQFCTGKNRVAYMPNPADEALEDQNNATKTQFDRDLMFCGVGNTTDTRYPLVKNLHDALQGKLRFDSFGMHGHAAVWGSEYEQILGNSKMALNLNRFEGWPLYSSDRIAHLMGSGILTFMSGKGAYDRFFSDQEVVFFDELPDLVEKITAFHGDDAMRRATAAAGRNAYLRLFSGARVVKFMVETTLGLPFTESYEWADEIYP
jgi:hypothetical protein